jgi:hypothetical protein
MVPRCQCWPRRCPLERGQETRNLVPRASPPRPWFHRRPQSRTAQGVVCACHAGRGHRLPKAAAAARPLPQHSGEHAAAMPRGRKPACLYSQPQAAGGPRP